MSGKYDLWPVKGLQTIVGNKMCNDEPVTSLTASDEKTAMSVNYGTQWPNRPRRRPWIIKNGQFIFVEIVHSKKRHLQPRVHKIVRSWKIKKTAETKTSILFSKLLYNDASQPFCAQEQTGPVDSTGWWSPMAVITTWNAWSLKPPPRWFISQNVSTMT